MRVANLQREEHTASVSICKWVAETERDPLVCVSFFIMGGDKPLN